MTVEDSGPGVGDTMRRTGLGLDIARRTAESAGGTMRTATSRYGGALVELLFPAA